MKKGRKSKKFKSKDVVNGVKNNTQEEWEYDYVK